MCENMMLLDAKTKAQSSLASAQSDQQQVYDYSSTKNRHES